MDKLITDMLNGLEKQYLTLYMLFNETADPFYMDMCKEVLKTIELIKNKELNGVYINGNN